MRINQYSTVRSPYLMINMLTGMAIIIVLLYPLITGNSGGTLQVECVHVTAHGGECNTCGLTRSFAEMARGNFTNAAMLNRNGPLIFWFFVIQLLMRAFFGYTYYRSGSSGIVAGPGTPADAGKPVAGAGIPADAKKRISGHGASADAGKPVAGPENAGCGKLKTIILTDALLSVALFVFCFRYLLFFWQ